MQSARHCCSNKQADAAQRHCFWFTSIVLNSPWLFHYYVVSISCQLSAVTGSCEQSQNHHYKSLSVFASAQQNVHFFLISQGDVLTLQVMQVSQEMARQEK